jgi:hypothetical protein
MRMAKSVGQNISYEVNGKNQLIITVDLNKTGSPSKSGKTLIVGSTQGNTKISDAKDKEVIFGLNVYRYKAEKRTETEDDE